MIAIRAVVLACVLFAPIAGCKSSKKSGVTTINSNDDYRELQAALNAKLISLIKSGTGNCDKLAADMITFYQGIEEANMALVDYERDHPNALNNELFDELHGQQRAALGACERNTNVLQAFSRSPVLPTPPWAVAPK